MESVLYAVYNATLACIMHNKTRSELEGCIRKKKVRDKHIFKGVQVIYLEESCHRNRMYEGGPKKNEIFS